AVVLVLELLGPRLIAPFFGATLTAWSSVITVTLAALAGGYALGGAAADRSPPWRVLGWALGLAAFWLALLPLLRLPVLRAAAGLGVQAGALAGSALLLGLPLLLLGAAAPCSVKLKAQSLQGIGRAAGTIGAISTAGSVAGALLGGFALIPRFGIDSLAGGCAALLALLAAVCFHAEGKGRALCACLALCAAVLAGAARAGPPGLPGLRARARSFYGDLRVVDLPEEGRRVLYIDGMPNTVADLRTLESTSDYIRSFELLHFLRPQAREALAVGLGGGGLLRRFWAEYGIRSDVVELDGAVAALARDWFGLRLSGDLFIEDGRAFLERGGRSYGFIVVDAFNGDKHPYHLFSREAFEAAARRLEGDGVLAVNVIGHAYGPDSTLRNSVERTLRSVFPHVRVLGASADFDLERSCVNLTFFASRGPLEFRQSPAGGRPELARYFDKVKDRFLETRGGDPEGLLLTDDYNPLETLSGPAELEIRRLLLLDSPPAAVL
ncbi:MAG: fused MFS/spermidine synthase, partial [Elusimicrobiota bacterium]